MKLGISSYSFLQAMRQKRMTMLDVPDAAARMGFESVDFAKLTPEGGEIADNAAKLKTLCRDAGLEIANYAVPGDFLLTPVQDEVQRLRADVEVAAALGAKTLRHDSVPWGFKGGVSFASVVDRLAEGYGLVTEQAKTLGIRTMIENHGTFAQDSDRIELLLNAVNNKNFGLLLDIGNFMCADESPLHAVGVLAPYAFHVHAKDFFVKPADAIDPGEGWFHSRGGAYLRGAIVGHGAVPVKPALDIMKNTGYDGTVALEFEGMEVCEEAIRISLANLKRYLA